MGLPKARPLDDPTTAYAEAVATGEYVVGHPVLWACQRHLDDLEHGGDRGLWFDVAAADRYLRFFHILRHFEGEWGKGDGLPFVPESWQEFILGSIFGWKREDGSRRFREAWVRVARKNGKSFIAAGVGNALLLVDGEAGAQVYTAASKRDQARVIHRAAIAQRDKSPSLRKRIRKFRDRLVVAESRSFFAPLGRDSDTEDGLNPHGALLDELHAHRDGGMWDVLESAMGARRQPLIFAITTSGHGVASFGKVQDDYYRSVVDPGSGVENDAAFVYIAELDEGDDPYDEAVWVKANPNLGVSVGLEYLRGRAAKAKQNPRFESDFFCKNLDMWVQASKRWLPLDRWDACAGEDVPEPSDEELRRRPCYGGLDLSSTSDLTAFTAFFPAWKGDPPALLAWFWVPEETVDVRRRRDRVDYRTWIRDGYMETTPGDWVDQERVRVAIREIRKRFPQLKVIALDPWNAGKLMIELEGDGFEVLRVHQGYAHLCAPSKELERLVLAGQLQHFAHPVLRWMASNAVVDESAAGDIKPNKAKSAEKIDGIMAATFSVGASQVRPPAPERRPTHTKLARERGGGRRRIFDAFSSR